MPLSGDGEVRPLVLQLIIKERQGKHTHYYSNHKTLYVKYFLTLHYLNVNYNTNGNLD